MIPWQQVEENAKQLDEQLEEITLTLTPLQFVVMSEIFLDVTSGKRVHMNRPTAVAETLRSMQFTFVKKGQ